MEDDFDTVASALADDVDGHGPLGEFVDALRDRSDDTLRLVARYTADQHDLLYVRPDIEEDRSAAWLDERVQTLALRGLGDPRADDALADFGDLNATIRWFDDVVVATFPQREWSGVVATFDRRDSPLVDAAVDALAA